MKKITTNKISVYLPEDKMEKKLVQRLLAIGAKEERSVNYLVIKAIEQFLEREEKKKR